ncbi:MAG: DNA polymerase domain-containing protein [Myxococcota bacterium]
MGSKKLLLDVDGQEVTVTSPDKIYFPDAGITKKELIDYYLAVMDGALRGVRGRPVILKRFVKGISEEAFFQKRAPKTRPDFIDTATLKFPSGRSATEVVLNTAAQLIWSVNLGCIDLNPHPIRADDLEHPDELRIDLDPVPGVEWPQIREVGFVVQDVLEELQLVGWPKTSGSRGLHIHVRVERRFTFPEVRQAALAVAREVERRAPTIATARWWKEEREGVFLDYNQNAKDRTVASAYSVRPKPDARVSTPVTWDELRDAVPEDFTLRTVPLRFQTLGDPGAGIDDAVGSLDLALALYERQEAEAPPRAPRPKKTDTGGGSDISPTGRRSSSAPLLVIAQAKQRQDAEAGLERWRDRYPDTAAYLEPSDVLVDAMRGRSSIWTRIRVNLRRVPEALRPPQETPDPNYDPRSEWR